MEDALKSWKAIAHFLDCSVKTAQRLERRHGLPVHRSRATNRVTALTKELTLWQKEMTLSTCQRAGPDSGVATGDKP